MNKPRKKTCSKDAYDTVFHVFILVLLAFLLALGKSPAQDPLISTARGSYFQRRIGSRRVSKKADRLSPNYRCLNCDLLRDVQYVDEDR